MNKQTHILDVVYQVILDRKANPTENSYTASLMSSGINRILKKVGEEATEVVIASKGGIREEIICETADLVFHLLVMLGFHDIPPDSVFDELRRRFGVSGLDEKATRTHQTLPASGCTGNSVF
jgi:phosphoribosyl-ATP pyrophosphohydrolase